jgi:catechol 2,3-dioxygenase
VTDLDESTEFYQRIWGLDVVDRTRESVYLRGTGLEHHLVALHRAGEPGVRRVTFGVADRTVVQALARRLGDRVLGSPSDIDEPGGGYGFSFRDPEGREIRIVTGRSEHAARGERRDVPQKLSHVLFESPDPARASAFYCENLDFRLRDSTGRNFFLGCNADHHCFGFGRGAGSGLNHVAFELPSIDGLMRGVGRLKRDGQTLEWGVGRHGPGANVFAYFFDPSGFGIEYTTEMEQVDDATYVPRTPEFWDKRVSSDAWGVAGPPSERFRSRGARTQPVGAAR